MEANKKAKELVIKYYSILSGCDIEYLNSFFSSIAKDMRFKDVKKCAIIAVDEVLKSEPLEISTADWDDCNQDSREWYERKKFNAIRYWHEVKNEITNL